MSSLTRREALRTAAAGLACLALPPVALAQKAAGYTLPKLPYATDALTAAIDEVTMEIHHGKHHKAYVDNANKALADHPKLLAMPVDELLANITKVPEKIRQAVINNAGGHSNHSIFWQIMGPKPGSPSKQLGKAIDKDFGSMDKFQAEFVQKGMTQFGSGWAWLVVNKKKELQTIQRANQNSPYLDGLTPILGNDVWEHAYYLRYKNARKEYLDAWWKVVNWEAVSDRYSKAMKA